MHSRSSRLAVLVVALFCSPARSTAQTGCSDAVKTLQDETRALHREAQGLGGAFLIYDGLDVSVTGALGAYGKRLDTLAKSKTDPLAPSVKLVRDAQKRQETLSSWEERLKRWGEGIAGYKNCSKNPDCSFLDWMKENEILNKELADWLKSVGEGGFEKATERVERASELLKNYTAKVGNAATGAMKTALECMRADTAQAQVAADQAAVQASPGRPQPRPSEPKPTPTVERGGGGGAGKVVGGLILVGGIAAGAKYAANKAAELNGSSDSGSSSGSSGMSLVSSSITCSFNGIIYNRCDGEITLNVRNSVSSNTSLRLVAGSSWFGVNKTTTTSLPGTITFLLNSITGPGSQSCPGPLTSLQLVATSTQNTLAVLNGISIPINCR